MSSTLPVRLGRIAQDPTSRESIRTEAMAQFSMSGGFMAAAQAHTDFEELLRANGASSMYSSKPKGQRGRCLPGAQMPAARLVVQGKLKAKHVSGHGVRTAQRGEASSEEDSEGDEVAVPGGARGGSGGQAAGVPVLPRGEAGKWTKPGAPIHNAGAGDLPGRRVLVFFPEAGGGDGGWFEGVVVEERPDGGITVYYPEDDEHEEISLPEPTIVFSTQPDSYVTVTRDMLPSV